MNRVILARGSSGGFSARSSSSSSTSSRSSSSSISKSTSTAKPGSSIKTSTGQTVKSSATKPSNSKFTQSKGIVGDNGYTPRFTGGYRAPAGSVVYYPEHSFVDYLPWIYLFSQHSPQNDTATVVQPDGKQVVEQPAPQGVDGLAVVNWIVLVIVVMAIIGGIVYLVNKFTNKENI